MPGCIQEMVEIAQHRRGRTPDKELTAIVFWTEVGHGIEPNSLAGRALIRCHCTHLMIRGIHDKRQWDPK